MVKYHSTGWFRDRLVPKDAGRYLGEFPGTSGLGMAKHHMFQYLHKTESLHNTNYVPWTDEKNWGKKSGV